jgi:uncharacterized membrane protein YbhN (UPF0104 family)
LSVKARKRLQGVLPWLVAGAILVWLFHAVPADALRTALGRGSAPLFVLTVVVFVFATLLADGLATWTLYRRSLHGVPLRLGETIQMRGATYILSVLHYGAGQGGMAYFLKTRYDVPLSSAAGAVMLTMGTNALTVAFCAFLGLALGGAPASPAMRTVVLVLASGIPGYLLVIALRPPMLRDWALLRPLFDAGVRGNLVIGVARLPHIAVLVTGHFVCMRLFDVQVPFVQAMALLPLVFIVGVMPIAPSGLGTAQATAVALFERFGPGDTVDARRGAVLAYSLSLQFAGLIGQALVGLVFLRLFGRSDTIDRADDPAGP